MMSHSTIALNTPFTDESIESLRAGDLISLSGIIYTGRDAAHGRMREALAQGEDLPFDPRGQVIYYVGPTPAGPGRIIGSAGPTTAGRMDPFTPMLIERGLKGMIGKGRRSEEVLSAMRRLKCVYFGAIEGTAALLSERIKTACVVAYEDLDSEALRRLVVEDFPLIVLNDIAGGDLYIEGRRKYRKVLRI